MLLKSLFKYWIYQVFSPGTTVLREKYEAFKLLLENDKCAHEVLYWSSLIPKPTTSLRKDADRIMISFSSVMKKPSRKCFTSAIDAELIGRPDDTIESKLDMVGRLLGATRLMDMYLKDESMMEGFVEDFMNGRYHFATVDDL